jgi:prepilin-type N-terminal cleavage/methylation domain-containing protein
MNRRGFTLIELMLSVAITSVVVAAISLFLVKQSQVSVKQAQQRTLEESGRQALLEIASSVRLAGAGIDPTAAFDFDRYKCTGNAITCNNNAGLDTPPTAASPGLRDKIDGPDELVVSYRDPIFSRTLKAIDGTGPYVVTFDDKPPQLPQPLNTAINAGRIAMLLCSGADPVSYVALASTAAVGATTVTLRTLTNDDGYFPQAPPADPCFAKGTLALVERVRYFVANDSDGVPALFRDRGRASDPQALFRGIEDLQLAYQIGSGTAVGGPPAGSSALPPACFGTSWIWGACANHAETPSENAGTLDWINDPYDSTSRYTGYAANIRAVQITIVARALQTSPDKAGDPPPALLPPATLANRNPPPPDPAGKKYVRTVLSMSEQTPNLLARARIAPNAGFSSVVTDVLGTREVLR